MTEDDELLPYQTCRFDKLTGWSDLCKTLIDGQKVNF